MRFVGGIRRIRRLVGGNVILWNVGIRKMKSAENDEISNHLTRFHDMKRVRCAEFVLLVEFGGSAV